ncbi:iron ABC transporter ATP-binding protein [Candidatus Epulonipiscium fishelsonii]|uniref:Iron ABC transporter ATP-binding protein n=1 Tax=Candidatus Epulonipiscium fishelsonii TaxID=77094 RepID=A0ACC8XE71_9FIRM|nr:iron ABC transporter ATP-binding protein [Epulopiscium sp. SCG-D08WGA-EpuloA1]
MKIINLLKQYGDRKVVDEVSFEFPKGKVTSMIGPNGAGKSTVLNIVTRLVPRDGGQILFEGKDIKDWKSKELSKKIAILTQANNIQMKLTVKELVSFGRFPYCGNRLTTEDWVHVNTAIRYMELEEFQDRFIDQLSGGQRQRAYIAMVIAQDTEYVFLDEPTNNLDIYHSSNMMHIARRLCDELGKTVVMVLHEINFASFYSDYICAFKDGKLHTFGTVEEVMNKKVLKELYNVDFQILDINNKPLSVFY